MRRSKCKRAAPTAPAAPTAEEWDELTKEASREWDKITEELLKEWENLPADFWDDLPPTDSRGSG